MPRDLESLGERIAEHAAHLDAAMHRLLSDLREFDQGGGWHAQGARSCAHWLSWRVGWDLGTAREHVRVAGKLAELPKIDRALEHGELSYSKVRAMSRVATAQNEDTILELARVSPAHQLEKICRKYAVVQRHDSDVRPEDDAQRRYVTRRDTADGMVRIEAVLHPEEAAIVWAALDHVAKQQCHESQRISAETSPAGAVVEQHAHDGLPRRQGSADAPSGTAAFEQDRQDRRCVPAETRSVPHAETSPAQTDVVPAPEPEPDHDHEQSGRPRHQRPAGRAGRSRFDRADALVAIAQAHVRGDEPDRSPIEVVVTVEASVLARPSDPTDPSTVACFRDGTCVSPETARRLCCDAGVIEITEGDHGNPLSVGRKTRTIPGSMKRALLQRDRTCRFPGCTNRVFLEGHHIEHWADGGQTKLSNLISICSHHHRFVHEYGYLIELDDDGPRFRDEHGRPVLDIPPAPRMTSVGWEAILSRNTGLEITARINECAWDGGLVHYAEAIDHLVRADRLE